VPVPYPISTKISWRSVWIRSMMLWSLHTENTMLISCGMYYDQYDRDTSTLWTRFVNFAAFTVSMTLNLA